MKRKALFLFFLIALFLGVSTYKNSEKLSLWFAIQTEKPGWVKAQIAKDLASFSSVTQTALDETFNKAQPFQTVRYRILNGKIYRFGEPHSLGRTKQFEKMLRRIQCSQQLPNVDFVVCLGNGVPESYIPQDFWITENQAPLLAWAKREGISPYVVLIPDILTTKEASWHKEIEKLEKKYLEIPWKERKEIAFWRGASNDKAYNALNYKEKPRFLISELSKKHPNLIDASFCWGHPESVESVAENLGLITIENHLDFKYLPLLDGHMCTFPGFQWGLLSGSVTFKQESDEVQYFYSALKPYEHFIPVERDMSDLAEKINWAKKHDAKSHLIAERARAFAHNHLMPNQIYAYLYWVLEEYERLQTFDLREISFGPQWQEQSH